MPLLVEGQRTVEWLQARLGKVTASIAAAALHLHPYKSARSAWREVTGQKTEAEVYEYLTNRHMQWGVQWEAPARLAYEAHTGEWVNETGLWVSDEYPWLAASPDGLIGEEGLVEVKAPEFAKHVCPAHYKLQCLVQLIVTRRKWCDYWSWGWRDQVPYLERVFPLSQTGEAALLRRLRRWHEQYVLGGEEPPRKPSRRRVVT